jgi:protein involved in polysaccharide export with SLBB domain
MRRVLYTIAFLAIVQTIVTAQTQTTDSTSSPPSAASESAAVRTRVVGPKVSNHAERQRSPAVRPAADDGTPQTDSGNSAPLWGNTAVTVTALPVNATATIPDLSRLQFIKPFVLPANQPPAGAKSTVAVAAASAVAASYDVGIGDVLDIRLSETPTRESTLFTVLKNGTIEYPLVAAPITVAGMTTDEVARTLTAQIHVIKAPLINVSVRDYASHAVVISGLVENPGRQSLRREAMPLYAMLAQASVRPEATTVTILHNGKEGPALSLRDEQALTVFVSSGDVIKVSGGVAPSQFVYVGGDVASPGEKSFREGMTLTQILLASGANPATSSTVKIARRGGAGLLSTSEYNLRSIKQGKVPDPFLEPGDRIEVTRAF